LNLRILFEKIDKIFLWCETEKKESSLS